MPCLRSVVRSCQTRGKYFLPWAVLLLIVLSATVQAAQPRVLPPGKQPTDVRLGPLRDLDGYFPYAVAPSLEQWQTRAVVLRQQLLVALGLWPLPAKTPLNPVIHGRLEQDGYTVEKVYFESMPGFFVTGSLFRPQGKTGQCPGVLCPHGHWPNGRFYDCGPEEIKKQIVQGAERFADSGRSPLQARCVQLARMGCVVFHWDMIGNADSQQISSEIIHGFKLQRPEMNRPQGWGLFSPPAESHLQSAMGLQAWNSIRALDFITSLPDVDATRIGVTGASGGGTQTFVLSAIDPRVQVAFPAVMVSTAMQGGCTCENACGLRIGTGNIEIAALFAPKPLAMTAANDWTVEMATKGFPELKSHYALFGAADRVKLVPLLHFDHNYNYVSRAAMYSWFNTHLKLGWPEPVVEEDYHRLTPEELTVWDDQHPRPEGGPEFERRLLEWWTTDAAHQIRGTAASRCGFAATVPGRGGQRPAGHPATLGSRPGRPPLGVGLATDPHRIRGDPRPADPQGDAVRADRVCRQGPFGGRPGAVAGHPAASDVVQWSHLHCGQPGRETGVVGCRRSTDRSCAPSLERGRLRLRRRPAVSRRVPAAGRSVETDATGPQSTRGGRLHIRLQPGAYLPSGFTTSCPSQCSCSTGSTKSAEIDLLAYPGAGHWAAAARALLASAIRRSAVDTAGFRFGQVSAIHDPDFLPGGAKYDDLPGMLAVAAPAPLFLAGEGDTLPELIASAYRAAGAPDAVQVGPARDAAPLNAAIDWLLSK